MSTAEKLYAHAVHARFGGYRPIWYPTTTIEVGDILELDKDGTFRRLGSLATYEHTKDLPVHTAQGATIPIDFVSTDGVSFTSKLAGATNPAFPTVPQANAGFSLDFKRQGDFLMYADAAQEHYLANVIDWEKHLNRLLDRRKWDTRYVIAAKVLRVPMFTLMLAQTSECRVEFSLEGTLTPSVRELGKVGVNATTTASRGQYVKITGAANVTPLVAGIRLEPRWFRQDRVFDEV